jgi:hypothetical protein
VLTDSPSGSVALLTTTSDRLTRDQNLLFALARADPGPALLVATEIAPTGYRPPRNTSRAVRRGIPRCLCKAGGGCAPAATYACIRAPAHTRPRLCLVRPL